MAGVAGAVARVVTVTTVPRVVITTLETRVVTTIPIKVYGSSLYLGSCCCRYTGSQADCGGATGDRPAAQIGSGASQECGCGGEGQHVSARVTSSICHVSARVTCHLRRVDGGWQRGLAAVAGHLAGAAAEVEPQAEHCVVRYIV